METQDIKDNHRFNITDKKYGEWFLGCNKCWFQLESNVAAKPVCPKCNNEMLLYTVKTSDIK